MADRRRYDNSGRQAAMGATRRRILDAAKAQFVEHGYPATTIERIAEAAGTTVPTVYRLFGTKRGLLKDAVDTSLVGDDEPVPFGDRPAVRAALGSGDPEALIDAFAAICNDVKDRAASIYRVLVTAAVVDPDAAALLEQLRSQAHTGRSRIVAALGRMDALDPALTRTEAEDLVYTCLSFEVAHILTVERGWTGPQYEAWISRSLRGLLNPDRPRRRRRTRPAQED